MSSSPSLYLGVPLPLSSAATSGSPEVAALQSLQQSLAAGDPEAIRRSCDRLETFSVIAGDSFWLAKLKASRTVAEHLDWLVRGLADGIPLITLSAYEALQQLKACAPVDANWDELTAQLEAGHRYREFRAQVMSSEGTPGDLFRLGRELERSSPELLTHTDRLRIELAARHEGARLRLKAALVTDNDRLIVEAYRPTFAAVYAGLLEHERARLALALLRDAVTVAAMNSTEAPAPTTHP
jgi:hypothetical protein